MDNRTRLIESLMDGPGPIIEAWAGLIQNSGMGIGAGDPAQLREECRGGLDSVIASLEHRQGDPCPRNRPLFGQADVLVGFPQVDATMAFLLGRQAMLDHVRPRIGPAAMPRALEILNQALSEAISQNGSLSCQVCMHRQEERRDNLQRRFESVLERSQDAILYLDDSRVVRYWNRGAEMMFGWSGEEMHGQMLSLTWDSRASGKSELLQLLREAASVGAARALDLGLYRADGSGLRVDASFTSVAEPEAAGAGTWAIFRDNSERHRLEEARLQSERLALIGTMSARLAHEVRNPLSSILLNLDLVQETLRGIEVAPRGPVLESRELVASIESEVQRVQSVVEDYLRFARLPKLRPELLGLDELLTRHVPLLEVELAQRRIDLEMTLHSAGFRVLADEAQLWQAVLNLVRNAMEAMPGGGRLRIRTHAGADDVCCEIEDTGAGMSPAVVASIFRPFFSTKHGGTGLGLPLTQQIIHEHHASLECHSVPGQGTRFVVRLRQHA